MATAATPETGNRLTWQLDPTHANIEFAVKHLMISTVRGRFGGVSGTVVTDGTNRVGAEVDITIDASSVDTRQDGRDQHLRSADFFDVEHFPHITFKGREVEQRSDDEFVLHGDLTIRGVTKPVELTVREEGRGRDPWGNERMGFSATTSVDRRDFGLTWNQALEVGGVAVGHDIRITIDAELMRPIAS